MNCCIFPFFCVSFFLILFCIHRSFAICCSLITKRTSERGKSIFKHFVLNSCAQPFANTRIHHLSSVKPSFWYIFIYLKRRKQFVRIDERIVVKPIGRKCSHFTKWHRVRFCKQHVMFFANTYRWLGPLLIRDCNFWN